MSPNRTPRRVPLRHQWPALLWLTFVWVMLWGEFSVGNIVAGVVVGIAVLLVFPQPPLPLSIRPHPVALARLVAVFLKDLVSSSVQVAALALRPGRPPQNAVIVVPLRTRSEFALMLTSELLSLVPGSLLIEASKTVWCVQLHIIDTPDLATVDRARSHVWAQELRVVEALGDADDIARVHQPPPVLPPAPSAAPAPPAPSGPSGIRPDDATDPS